MLVDRSHWGRLRVAGSGQLEFLHGQTTADINKLTPGQGTQTVSSAMPSLCTCTLSLPEEIKILAPVAAHACAAGHLQQLYLHLSNASNIDARLFEGRGHSHTLRFARSCP